jgi:hypothetical protein
MYYTGLDPFTREPVYTAKDLRDKKLQKALLLYWDPAQHTLAREALRKAGRADLIGHRPGCLVPPEAPVRSGTTRGTDAGAKAGAPDGPGARRHGPPGKPRRIPPPPGRRS